MLSSIPVNTTFTGAMDRPRAFPRFTYVDVLNFSTVSQAVDEASRMLRRGILHAMSCDVADSQPSAATYVPTIPQSEPPQASAVRDPLSVYSAVTKRPRKANSPSDSAPPAAQPVATPAASPPTPPGAVGNATDFAQRDPPLADASAAHSPTSPAAQSAPSPQPLIANVPSPFVSMPPPATHPHPLPVGGAEPTSTAAKSADGTSAAVSGGTAVHRDGAGGDADVEMPAAPAKPATGAVTDTVAGAAVRVGAPVRRGAQAAHAAAPSRGSAVHNWDSAKRAGPSILSKRGRTSAEEECVSEKVAGAMEADGGESVATDGELGVVRTDDDHEKSDVEMGNAQSHGRGGANQEVKVSGAASAEEASEGEKSGAEHTGGDVNGGSGAGTAKQAGVNSSVGDSVPVERSASGSGAKKVSAGAVSGITKKLHVGGDGAGSKASDVAKKVISKVRKSKPEGGNVAGLAAKVATSESSRNGTSASATKAGTRKSGPLPPGTITGLLEPSRKSVVTTSLRKKAGIPPARKTTTKGTAKAEKGTPLPIAQQQALAQRGGLTALGSHSVRGAGTGVNADAAAAATVKTNTGGLELQHVPGSKTVQGVKPNGYTVSKGGVVKPVAVFSPPGKVPLRFRQTGLEKLFSAWRDEKKLAEAEALQLALQTEQEMYANSSSKVDYRAALMSKLKAIRA